MNPIPDEKSIRKFYEFENSSLYGAYREIDPEIECKKREKLLVSKKNLTRIDRFFGALLGVDNRVLDLLTYVKSRAISFHKVLDVGCGSGYFTMQLIKLLQLDKKDVCGIDIYPEVEQFGKKLDIKMKTARLKEYTDSEFDLIVLSHVLEHEPDPKTMIKEVYKKLADGGILYLSLPNSQSLPTRIFGKKWICYGVPRHVYNFSKESILRITENLFVLEYYSSGRFFSFIFTIYHKSKLWSLSYRVLSIFLNPLFDALFLLLNIGDNQSFIFKKRSLHVETIYSFAKTANMWW